MLKRTLFLGSPMRVSTKLEQLVIELRPKVDGIDQTKTVPIEDIGFVVLEHPQISISLPALNKLNANNVAVVFCDDKHMPSSMLLNLDGHHLQSELFRAQLSASEPLKKRLWKQTIEAKIKNQAAFLKHLGKSAGSLPSFASAVKSGDTDNREAAAAREYWQRLMGTGFVRERYGESPNELLNYGYIILRAAVARSLVGSGLLPVMGIHHHNRYNAYCLADDIMEPYRVYVDDAVYELWESRADAIALDKQTKARLLQVLSCDVKVGKVKRPLMVALSMTTASLGRCFGGEEDKMSYPTF